MSQKPPTPIMVRAWRAWTQPRASDPFVGYRERGLRILLALITPLRAVFIAWRYSGAPQALPPYFPLAVSLTAFAVPLAVSLWLLRRRKVDLAAFFFLLHWYLADMLNLPAEGYWQAGLRISLILQIVLAAYLLPGWAILPYLGFHLLTLGAWGAWLDGRVLVSPLLASGRPLATFPITLASLAAMEVVFILVIRLWHRDVERHLHSQLEDVTLLRASALTTAADATEDALLQEFVQLIQDALQPDTYGLALWDEAAGVLRIHVSSHGLPPELLGAPIPPGQGIVGTVAATRWPICVANVRKDPRYVSANPLVRSELCVPMESAGRLIGVMDVESRKLNAFSAADERLLLTLGGQLAAGLERCRTGEALRRLNAELEARVRERTAQLEAANRDLEDFAYSISHDLRAPLRSIDGFSRIVLEDYAQSLDAEGQRHLRRIVASVQRMSQLIDALLDFSRLGRQPLSTRVCDPAALVRAVWDDLRPSAGERAVQFSLGDLPPCQADPPLLRQVFFNLLSNAVKYTSPRPAARIEAGWAAGAYFVRDNGVGFDMQYAHRLFGVFQRLHSAEDFEGTGVGLAIVKRIVERHGGHVWAEAALDQGATFYFTLGRPLGAATPSAE